MALQFLGSASDSNLDSIDVKRVSVVTRQVDPPLTFVRNDECFAKVAKCRRGYCRPVWSADQIQLAVGTASDCAAAKLQSMQVKSNPRQAGDQKIKLQCPDAGGRVHPVSPSSACEKMQRDSSPAHATW